MEELNRIINEPYISYEYQNSRIEIFRGACPKGLFKGHSIYNDVCIEKLYDLKPLIDEWVNSPSDQDQEFKVAILNEVSNETNILSTLWVKITKLNKLEFKSVNNIILDDLSGPSLIPRIYNAAKESETIFNVKLDSDLYKVRMVLVVSDNGINSVILNLDLFSTLTTLCRNTFASSPYLLAIYEKLENGTFILQTFLVEIEGLTTSSSLSQKPLNDIVDDGLSDDQVSIELFNRAFNNGKIGFDFFIGD